MFGDDAVFVASADVDDVALVFVADVAVVNYGFAEVSGEAGVDVEGSGSEFDVVLETNHPGDQRRGDPIEEGDVEVGANVGLQHDVILGFNDIAEGDRDFEHEVHDVVAGHSGECHPVGGYFEAYPQGPVVEELALNGGNAAKVPEVGGLLIPNVDAR